MRDFKMSIFKKKYYCHKCGDILYKNPNTKVITHKDPEWKENLLTRKYFYGKAQITEYNLKCLTCRTTIDYEKQEAIRKIQNKLQKNVLTDEEYNEHKEEIDNIIIENKKNGKRKTTAIGIFILILIIVFKLITSTNQT